MVLTVTVQPFKRSNFKKINYLYQIEQKHHCMNWNMYVCFCLALSSSLVPQMNSHFLCKWWNIQHFIRTILSQIIKFLHNFISYTSVSNRSMAKRIQNSCSLQFMHLNSVTWSELYDEVYLYIWSFRQKDNTVLGCLVLLLKFLLTCCI